MVSIEGKDLNKRGEYRGKGKVKRRASERRIETSKPANCPKYTQMSYKWEFRIKY
jgi:hypothetical protein